MTPMTGTGSFHPLYYILLPLRMQEHHGRRQVLKKDHPLEIRSPISKVSN